MVERGTLLKVLRLSCLLDFSSRHKRYSLEKWKPERPRCERCNYSERTCRCSCCYQHPLSPLAEVFGCEDCCCVGTQLHTGGLWTKTCSRAKCDNTGHGTADNLQQHTAVAGCTSEQSALLRCKACCSCAYVWHKLLLLLQWYVAMQP